MTQPSEPNAVAGLVTAPGIGGLSVVQVAGPRAVALVTNYLQNRRGRCPESLTPQRLRLFQWMDGDEHIDDVVVVVDGRTGVVSITVHGSIRVVERVLMCLEAGGAHIVRGLTGESLWQGAQPVEDSVMRHLPSAQTRQVGLWLLQQIEALPQDIQTCIALLARKKVRQALERLDELKQTFCRSRILLHGGRVVIVGPPNAGKSTLANRLFDRPWSIESPEPGTTRDYVHQPVVFDGVPVVLMDTAGLRESSDPLESRAMRRTRPLVREAHAQLLVLDGATGHEAELACIGPLLRPERVLVVLNKCDLGVNRGLELQVSNFVQRPPVVVSALLNQGLDAVRSAVAGVLGLARGQWPSPAIWDDLHRTLLEEISAGGGRDVAGAIRRLQDTFLGTKPGK